MSYFLFSYSLRQDKYLNTVTKKEKRFHVLSSISLVQLIMTYNSSYDI